MKATSPIGAWSTIPVVGWRWRSMTLPPRGSPGRSLLAGGDAHRYPVEAELTDAAKPGPVPLRSSAGARAYRASPDLRPAVAIRPSMSCS
jgi:hypothetical protein